jgi:hypothetical protein
MITQTHKTCEFHSVEIDWDHTNKDGLPAIVCEQCKNSKGKRRGKAKWVSWLSRKDLYKIQFGADWQDKYHEHQSMMHEAEEREKQQRQRDTFDGTEHELDAPGNYSAYTG